MQNDLNEKRPVPGNDPAEPILDENISRNLPEENKEQDPDDLVHSDLAIGVPSNEEEEIDADDIIHKTAPDPTLSDDTEKDPDDLVHGN